MNSRDNPYAQRTYHDTAGASQATCVILLALLLVALTACRPAERQSTPPQLPEADAPRAAASYASLPLSFEPNRGQAADAVRFLARGRGYTLFLSAAEALFALQARPARQSLLLQPNPPGFGRAQDRPPRAVDADPAAEVAGLEQQPGKVNYFIGNDPSRWRTGIPTYAQVQVVGRLAGRRSGLLRQPAPARGGLRGGAGRGPRGHRTARGRRRSLSVGRRGRPAAGRERRAPGAARALPGRGRGPAAGGGRLRAGRGWAGRAFGWLPTIWRGRS